MQQLVLERLGHPHLRDHVHGRILNAAHRLRDQGRPITVLGVVDELGQQGVLDPMFVHGIIENRVPSRAVATAALEILERDRRRRAAIVELRALEEGADPDEVLTRLRDEMGDGGVQLEPFPLYGVGQLDDLPSVEWIVDGLVQDREGILLYGQRGTGKSLVALDLGCHIAAGLDWRGRPTVRGDVVLVALENVDALPGRLRAWQAAHPDADLSRFHFTTAKVRARSDVDERRLHRTLDALDEPPALVIIDTHARFAAGLDERSEIDMGVVVDWLTRITERTGHAVMLVHHAGKDPGRGARGSSVLEASFTAVAQVTKSIGGVVTLEADKVNNGPEGWDHSWMLAVDDLGPHLHPLHPKQPLLAKLREIRAAVEDEPGLSKRALEDRLSGRAESIRSAIEDALELGVIVNNGTGRAHAYHPGDRTPEDACEASHKVRPDPSANATPGTHRPVSTDTPGHTLWETS